MAPPIGPSVADAPIGTQTPSILAGGSPLAETWLQMLIFVRVDRGVGLVGRATLKFMDTGFALSASSVFSLGTDVVIMDGSQEHYLMVGTVTALSLEQPTNGATQLVVTVDDHASKLAAVYLTGAHLNKTFKDIIREMVGGVRMSAELKIKTGLPQETHEYLLQSGSCLDYLNWMSERSGSVWWIDHAGTLVVDDE